MPRPRIVELYLYYATHLYSEVSKKLGTETTLFLLCLGNDESRNSEIYTLLYSTLLFINTDTRISMAAVLKPEIFNNLNPCYAAFHFTLL